MRLRQRSFVFLASVLLALAGARREQWGWLSTMPGVCFPPKRITLEAKTMVENSGYLRRRMLLISLLLTLSAGAA